MRMYCVALFDLFLFENVHIHPDVELVRFLPASVGLVIMTRFIFSKITINTDSEDQVWSVFCEFILRIHTI